MEITAFFVPSRDDSDADHKLSVSKVKTFDSCKAKYKYSYIEKLPKKEFEFHIFGTFCHDVLENFHLKLIELAKEGNISDKNKDDAQIDRWPEIMKICFTEAVETFK